MEGEVKRTCIGCLGDLLLALTEKEELKPMGNVTLCNDSHLGEKSQMRRPSGFALPRRLIASVDGINRLVGKCRLQERFKEEK